MSAPFEVGDRARFVKDYAGIPLGTECVVDEIVDGPTDWGVYVVIGQVRALVTASGIRTGVLELTGNEKSVYIVTWNTYAALKRRAFDSLEIASAFAEGLEARSLSISEKSNIKLYGPIDRRSK